MSDSRERLRALDPSQSFLVQAPAGSGKTALLTQRFLRLLAVVDEPEQILAITFTRKAAAEMRVRVLGQLCKALEPAPERDFERQSWELARAALDRDREQGWGILASPRRLRVQTIDGFQRALVKRMPWLSRWGAGEGLTENAAPIYRDAVREALRALAEDPGKEGENLRALIDLLNLRDNKLEVLSEMLVRLVGRRDEWISALGTSAFAQGDMEALREQLELNIRLVVEAELRKIHARVPPGFGERLAPLARFAAANLADQNHAVEALASFRRWPEPSAEELPVWRGLGELLLTGDGGVRKGLDKRTGFPTTDRDAKERMKALLDGIRDNASFAKALAGVKKLPDAAYTEDQWRILRALFRLMRVLIPSLQLQFAERHESDFMEVTLRAAAALEEAPGVSSVLAERLDARLQHILVDEFQDTSVLQMHIIRKLTENWTPGDGRSLFLVGDPMQSIYGWRNARVDLFLRAWSGSLPGLPPLETLQLKRNFRSRPRLIEECNAVFQTLFPLESDPSTGAVVHAPATPGRSEDGGAGARIHCHPFLASDPIAEAEWIAAEILRLRGKAAQGREKPPTVGVLFRKGENSAYIAQALVARGLRYQAVDIEFLKDLPVITDLRSLLAALISAENRLAWWAVLRAPWNGLALRDLEELHLLSRGGSVWEAIRRACREDAGRFAPETLRRLERMREIFQQAMDWRGRRPLAHLLRALFLNTGAARCYPDARSQLAAGEFFRLVLNADEAELMGNPTMLDEELGRMKAPVDPDADNSLQLLTIHKAKGLEFDVVFVPCLNASPPPSRGGALSWDEMPVEGEADEVLVMVPGKATADATSALGRFLASRRSKREQQERLRVLYVAFTRAKETLHLLATIDPKGCTSADELKLKRDSYLKELWSYFEAPFRTLFGETRAALLFAADESAPAVARSYPLLRRLSLASLPEIYPEPGAEALAATAGPTRFYRPGGSWETLESASGTVFHRVMELASDASMLARIRERGAARMEPLVLDALRSLLPAEPDLQPAAGRILEALRRTAASATGQWIFHPSHQRVLAEQSIAYTQGDTQREARLDRVFQDAEGHWHIVDFKLVSGDAGDRDTFLTTQRSRYHAQLEEYARLFQQTYPGPVTLTLYFPLQDEHIQWTIPLLAHRA